MRTLATVACLSYVGGAQDGGKFCDWVRVYVQRCGAKDLPSRFREGLHRVNEDNYRDLCSDLRASNRAGRACFKIDDRFVSGRQAAAIRRVRCAFERPGFVCGLYRGVHIFQYRLAQLCRGYVPHRRDEDNLANGRRGEGVPERSTYYRPGEFLGSGCVFIEAIAEGSFPFVTANPSNRVVGMVDHGWRLCVDWSSYFSALPSGGVDRFLFPLTSALYGPDWVTNAFGENGALPEGLYLRNDVCDDAYVFQYTVERFECRFFHEEIRCVGPLVKLIFSRSPVSMRL